MNIFRSRLGPALISVLIVTTSACTTHVIRPEAAEAVRQQPLDGLPYHPLVYHLDLSILAYHLYGQSLAWPFDPYYEDVRGGGARKRLMRAAHDWARRTGALQVETDAGLDAFRGPGSLSGFENNPWHDPIVYRYDRLRPWSPAITNAAGTWTEYLTPSAAVDNIGDIRVCYRPPGEAAGPVAIRKLVTGRDGRDVLLAFEGGTGDKGEPGRPASQSLMGFALLRFTPGGDRYDVHIAFRGSRSGSAGHALWQSLSDGSARGNPDWITDLGYNPLTADTGGGPISTVGAVSRGFATSVQSILPQLYGCLKQIPALVPGGQPPRRLFVTGHSLGGALAQHFASSVLIGDSYGPAGQGAAMPVELRQWPWAQLRLITYGAPRAGNTQWARTLTEDHLQSGFFATVLNPFDSDALTVADPSIVRRLTDTTRPAAFRVLISRDPITTEKFIGGKHVGKTVYVDKRSLRDVLRLPDVSAHEPFRIRQLMLDGLGDPRIPPLAWRYLEMHEVNPGRVQEQAGTAAEYRRLIEAVNRYYRDREIWFDHDRFMQDAEVFLGILHSASASLRAKVDADERRSEAAPTPAIITPTSFRMHKISR